MSIVNNFIDKIRNVGIFKTIQLCICKAIGISNQQIEIDTLYFFLNEYLDITKLPYTKNIGLRNLQLCDVELLKIIDKICNKYNIIYWLDYGTLLGAVRHKGFIPWDDDMDISMPREDYNRFREISPKLFQEIGIEIEENNGRIGIGYNHNNTAIWCDVFPVDPVYTNATIDKIKPNLKKIKHKYYNKVKRHTLLSAEYVDLERLKYFKNYLEGDNKYYLLELEFSDSFYALSENTIFPLIKIEFEGYTFNAPNRFNEYLTELYGSEYMKYPRSGILHHGLTTGRLPLGEWAAFNGIDMLKSRDDLHHKLLSIN